MGEFEFVVNEGPHKGSTVGFPGRSFFVGSAPDCQVRFPPELVQPRHAEIRFDTNGVPWIRDLTGQRQMWLNGTAIDKGAIASGSVLRLGGVELLVRRQQPAARPAPMPEVPWSRGSGIGLSPLGPAASLSAPAIVPTINITPAEPMALGDGNDDTLVHGRVKPSEIALPGSTIDGRYAVIEKIAVGGMGEVYLARHIELGKDVALKVMLPELSNDPEFVGRFKREAIAASRIGQQNIVDISDFGRTPQGRFYFVMEFLDGVTLASLLHAEPHQPRERALMLSVQIARALAAAHAQGIVHRDLKPENVMVLQRPGQPDLVKVLDFGVAKVAQGPGHGGHTAVGLVVGTPQYMSPEQAKAVPVDTRSDIYSLGLIIYELLAGAPPFTAETPSMLMVKHVTEPVPPFMPGPPSVPEGQRDVPPAELQQLVFAMLEKEPEHRPQLMDEVVARLENLLARLRVNDPQLFSPAPFTSATPQPRGPGSTRATGRQQPVLEAPLAQPLEPTSVPTPAQGRTSGLHPGAAAPGRSKLPYVMGGVVAVLGIAVVVVVLFGPSAPPPAPVKAAVAQPVAPSAVAPAVPEPPPVAVADKVKLTFTSKEPTEVFEGDVLLGATPLTLTRATGDIAALSFRAKGFEPIERKVKFESEQTIELSLVPEKKVAPKRPTVPSPDEPTGEELKELPF